MCKVIAVGNQKGGVGKTTTTSNLGIGLAKKGKKVLLIDADAQGSLTASLGFQEPDKLDASLATVMANIINEEDMEPDYGILKHDEGVDLMPGNIELSGLEVSLVNVMSRELVLRTYIEQQKERYDYILIDCMPSLGMITINAFASADSILIPVQAAYLPVKGLQQLIKTIGRVALKEQDYDKYARKMKKYLKWELIILDDFLLHTITDEREIKILFELLEKRNEQRKSTIVCSQRDPDNWKAMILNDEVSANSIMKRATKHYTIKINTR